MRISPLLRVLVVLVWLASLVAGLVGIGSERVMAAWIAFPGWGAVGMLLALKRPANPIGWILLMGSAMPLGALVATLHPAVQNGILVASVALVLVLFPTGRPPGRIWFVPMVLVGLSWTLGMFVEITIRQDLSIPAGVVLAGASLLWCAAAPIVRFRRSTGLERAQLRWLRLAAVVCATGAVILAIGLATDFEPLAELAGLIEFLGLALGLPGAILIAVLRYRLYGIDRLVSRSITFLLLAAAVTALFAVPVLLVPELLGSSSDLVTAASTLAAAAAFNPLRRRIRRVVDHRFNRSAFDTETEIRAIGARIRDEVDVATITADLTSSVSRTLQPRSVALWLGAGEGLR